MSNASHLQIKISTIADGDMLFKAYLENSQHGFELESIEMPFMSNAGKTSSVVTRRLENANFVFNVLSESRSECIKNFKSLRSLTQAIKPYYLFRNYQLVPETVNFGGFLTVNFNGFPKNRRSIHLKLKNFSYEIDKEAGFLEVPKSEVGASGGGKKYIPIAYKLTIAGDILLDFKEVVSF